MATSKDQANGRDGGRKLWRWAAQGGVMALAVLVTAGSAILVKELSVASGQPIPAAEVVKLSSEVGTDGLVRYRTGEGRILPVSRTAPETTEAEASETIGPPVLLGAPEEDFEDSAEVSEERNESAAFEYDDETLAYASDPNIRWFNGRPVRPARTLWMTVTGYSPHAASCAPFDDGLTATLHSVKANATRMVAADTRLLPFGSLVTVPGYDQEQVVPVLDRGGAIKGFKLDLMFPTHEEAIQWGRQRVEVTVWEYADGLPADNPREFR